MALSPGMEVPMQSAQPGGGGDARRPRRSHCTGSLFTGTDAAGRETYYGQWRVGGRIVKRRIGPKRVNGTRQGPTKAQAEAALRKLMAEVTPAQVAPSARVGIEEAGKAYIGHVETVLERKPTTITDYRIILRRHLVPHFGQKPLGRITVQDVNAYIVAKSRTLASKTVVNHMSFLHAVLRFAMRRGWASANPVELADRPRQQVPDHDLRYLTPEEVEALLRAVPEDAEGSRDRALYATAAWLVAARVSWRRCAGVTSTGRPG